MAAAVSSRRWMRIMLDVITGLLGLQFLVGMLLNTYVTLPLYTTQNIMLAFFSNTFLLVHAAVAVLTFLSALFAVVLSVKHHWPRRVLILNILSALSILAAGIAGLEFLLTQCPLFSMSMAVLWLVSFGFVGFSQSSMRSDSSRQRIKNA